MDDRDFDALTRSLAHGPTRRHVLRGLVAAIGAVGVARLRPVAAAGNGPCAKYCVDHYRPGPERAACIVAAAQGEGRCPSCDSGSTLCRAEDGQFYCPDLQNDPTNCGACGTVCGGGDDCNTANCVAGRCETVVNVGASCDGDTGTCDADGFCQPNATPLICEAGAVCQSACPGSLPEDNCSCGTTFDGGDPVCYRAEHGCPGPYCDTSDDCAPGYACVSLLYDGANPCGGCDNYINSQEGRLRGVCNPICTR